MNFWQGKKVLITGHTGFKGSWLTLWLKMLGAEICGYALLPPTEPSLFEDLNLREQIKSVTGDICDLPSLEKTVREFEPEIVFHLAAQSLVRRSYREPVETYQTNVIGTVNLLESVRRTNSVKSVVIATTDKVYQNREWRWAYREDDALGGFDPYSNSKACAELVASSYRNSFFDEGKTLLATARAGNVIGGGDWSEDRLLPDIFRSLIFKLPLEIRHPEAIRPWQYVLEPLRGYLVLAEKLYDGSREFADAWNFGPAAEDAKTVRWVLEQIRSVWDSPADWKIGNSEKLHEARLLKLDSTKAGELLDWHPYLNSQEAISLTAHWYRAFGKREDLRALTESQIEIYQNRLGA